MVTDMDPDTRCREHDHEILSLKGQFLQMNKDMDTLLARVQQLVDEYHAIRITLAQMAKDIEVAKLDIAVIKNTLKDDVAPKETVDAMRKQWAMIGSGVILSVIGIIVTWLLRGGLVGVVK
jgi:hypothetical protein